MEYEDSGTVFPPAPIVRAYWSPAEQKVLTVDPGRPSSVDYFLVKDAVVSPNRRGGYVIQRRSIFTFNPDSLQIPKLFIPGPKVGRVTAQVGNVAWVQRGAEHTKFSKAIFAGSMAPHNWVHWTIDNLPNFFSLSRLPEDFAGWPLLVPQEGLERKAWREAFEYAIGDRPYVPVDSGQLYSVQKLVIVERVTTPSPRPLELSETPRIGIHEFGITKYRQALEAQIPPRPEGLSKRLFLVRESSDARAYNQDAALSLAESYGFCALSLRDVSLAESVAAFKGAEAIIGAHGAGWAGLLHANPGLEVLFWAWEGLHTDNWYENLAAISGVSFRRIDYRPDEALTGSGRTGDPRFASYTLDLDMLEDELRALDSRVKAMVEPET